MATRMGTRRETWGAVLCCAIALTACGESTQPLSTATPSPMQIRSTIGPAATATPLALIAPTPEVTPEATEATPPPSVGTLSPASPAPNAPTTGVATARTAPQMAATPTPLAFGTTAARATTVASTARATAAPSTPITGSTSGSAVAAGGTSTSGTSASGTVVSLTPGTRPATTGTASSGTTVATVPATRAAATMAAMATETAPTVRAQDTVVNFLNVVLRNGDLNTFLSPGLRGQGGAQVLGITGTIRMFEVTGERPDPDGTGTIVSATITTAAGTVMKQLHMSRSGNAWVIDRVG